MAAGAITPVLQTPSRFEKDVVRILSNPKGDPRTQHARTPHHLLNGEITPNSLHFTINHSGLPDIDPAQHKLVIHGMVKQPQDVHPRRDWRAIRWSRATHFVECGGNSAAMFSNEPVQATLRACTAWSPTPSGPACCSRPCSTRPASIPKAVWMLAEGADFARPDPQRAGQEGPG